MCSVMVVVMEVALVRNSGAASGLAVPSTHSQLRRFVRRNDPGYPGVPQRCPDPGRRGVKIALACELVRR